MQSTGVSHGEFESAAHGGRATRRRHFFFFLPIPAAASFIAFFSSACFLRNAISSCASRSVQPAALELHRR